MNILTLIFDHIKCWKDLKLNKIFFFATRKILRHFFGDAYTKINIRVCKFVEKFLIFSKRIFSEMVIELISDHNLKQCTIAI